MHFSSPSHILHAPSILSFVTYEDPHYETIYSAASRTNFLSIQFSAAVEGARFGILGTEVKCSQTA
jgi:hypothetical protein